jgi:Flp pilus assembly protein TadD
MAFTANASHALGPRGAALLLLAAALPLLGGCTGVVAMIPDSRARAEWRAQKRHDAVLEQQRARAAALREPSTGADKTFVEHLRDGDRFRDQGQLSKASLSYVRAHWLDPESPKPPERLAFLALRESPARAEAVFEELLESLPGEAVLQTGLGMARLGRDRIPEARQSLETAVALAPDSVLARSTLGVVYDRLELHDEAQAQYAAALELRPRDVDVLNNLGVSYLLAGDYERSAATLQRALDQGARDPAVQNNLGLAYGFQGRDDAALAAFRAVGSVGDAYNNLGYVHLLQGDYAEATRLFERALLSNDTDEGRVVRNIAMVEQARAKRFGAAPSPLRPW